jgi:LuxR family maltose regulon positive regulatory protein
MSLNRLLVSTKFAPPRVGSRYIVRSQLLDALQRGKHCKLTLVTGSAGFGKTILLAQWRQELLKTGLPVAWLSLSHDERLLPNFCAHVFDALERLGVPLEDEVLLAGEGIASMDSIVAAIVNGLATIDDDL